MKPKYTTAILVLFLLGSPIYAVDAVSVQPELELMVRAPDTTASFEKFIPIYYADGYQSRGSVYYALPERTIYTRPSGKLYSFTFHPGVPEKLYYANSNQRNIYTTHETGTGWTAESIVFTHKTYVRDIAFAFDQRGNLGLYFSEASGAGGDGRIYKIDGEALAPIYDVKLSEVGGFWGGDFTFDYDGNLYLSSGNRVPASIYKVSTGTVTPTKIFESRTAPIAGLVYRNGYLYYADWRQNICRLDLRSMTSTVYYTDSSRTNLSDVGFKEKRDSAGNRPTAGTYYPLYRVDDKYLGYKLGNSGLAGDLPAAGENP